MRFGVWEVETASKCVAELVVNGHSDAAQTGAA